jgi:hypothetical protein
MRATASIKLAMDLLYRIIALPLDDRAAAYRKRRSFQPRVLQGVGLSSYLPKPDRSLDRDGLILSLSLSQELSIWQKREQGC